MRATLCIVVFVVGCSSKSETKSEAKVETKTPEDKAGEQAAQPPSAPPEAKPAEPPPAPAAITNVECAKLVTAEDVAKACGGSKVDVAEGSSKIKAPHTVCSLRMAEPGKKFPIAQVQLMVFPDPGGVDGWIKLDKIEGSKDVAGIGDLAWTRVDEQAALKSTNYDVGVRKGNAVLKILMTQNSLNKKLPCTLEQATELARIVAPRLP
jgi:hypothetical protein